MVAGICATQANLGTVPPTPEKAGWHEQTGVGEEDEEDLEELPPEAFMDSDESADEDFLDNPDFYSLLDKQGSFWDVEGGGDSTMGTPSQHEAAELMPEGGMQQAEMRKEWDMRVLNRGLFLLHKAAKLQAAGLARIQAICRSSPDFGMLLRAFSLVHVPDLTAGALTPQVPMLAPLSKHPQIQGEQMKPVPVGVVDSVRFYKCPSCTVPPPKTWVAIDAHIRKEHLKLLYGPCPYCGTFTTAASGSFHWHKLACRKAHGKDPSSTMVRPPDNEANQ